MKANHFRARRGFTLIELLVVIALVGTVAALLLPALSRGKRQALVARAQMELTEIVAGIGQYESEFSRLPSSTSAERGAMAANEDFTYGGTFRTPSPGGTYDVKAAGPYQTENWEVMAVLCDLEFNRRGARRINKNHVRNPEREIFLDAAFSNGTTNTSGIGTDGIYRDPWHNPYVITLDLNNDWKARDAFYRLNAVSSNSGPKGYNSLFNSQNATGRGDFFDFAGTVMVWSAGPDGIISPTTKANQGVNKDNVLSW